MIREHYRIRAVAPAIVAVALICGSALAGPPIDPMTYSTGGAGQLLSLGGEGPPGLPGLAPAGRATPTLLKAYPAWDYWNLDTLAVRDGTGKIHFGVRLWQYNDQIPNYDRYVLNSDGELLESWLDWYGLGGMPGATDGNGHNVFLRPSCATQYFGVVDSADYIYAFNTSSQPTGWEVHYSKMDPQGNTVIDWSVITVGADCWNWYLQPVVTSDDTIIVTWIRDTQDICAISSTDGGVTWSDIRVLLVNAGGGDQAAAIKTVIGADDSLHFVWRTLNWTTSAEYGWYAKVRPDWSIAVDETRFHVGPCWYPNASIDNQDSVHITFAPYYDVATDMYYTRLRGDLDLGGAPASDALLTTIPERLFYSDPDMVHYPANQVDENGTVHVIYEEGTYGRGTDKDLYYVALCSLGGDLNCDEAVDFDDLDRFAPVLAGPENLAPPDSDATDFANGDLDDDEDADLADFAALQGACGSG